MEEAASSAHGLINFVQVTRLWVRSLVLAHILGLQVILGSELVHGGREAFGSWARVCVLDFRIYCKGWYPVNLFHQHRDL